MRRLKVNPLIRIRLAALALAVALMGALIVLVTLNIQHQGDELRARLSIVDQESFGIADRFRENLRGVSAALLQYRIHPESESWEQYLKAKEELDTWMEQQAPKLTTEAERALLVKVVAEYREYLRQAEELHRIMESPGEHDVLAGFPQLRAQSEHLYDVAQALSRAHYDSRNQLLNHANQTLVQIRRSIIGLVVLLFLFGVALALVVYRDMIAPLRLKLVESQAQAERHEKLASLGLLAAGVAHEIRNPLTAVKAALFTQSKKLDPGSSAQQDVKVIGREISRLERIVNDFLQFARPADPELVPMPAQLPLSEVRLFFDSALARDNIRLVLEPSPPLHIKADSGQIKQVLINLVRNAAESIGHDGTITLRARHARKRLASQAETDVVVLEVADTGKGIAPEVEKRLFDPFFTTKESGTGLGLPIAARIVQKHGGILQYQSQVDQGATFGVVLPQVAE